MVAERNDLPSSRASYDGTTAKLQVDWTKDVISLGPFEENAHVENSGSGAGRARASIAPGASPRSSLPGPASAPVAATTPGSSTSS